MKKVFYTNLLLLALVLFCQCEKKESNPDVPIPDEVFLNALVDRGVDTNGDGIIQKREAEKVTFLDLYDEGILDLTGIEEFVNLDTLKCFQNLISSLDLSNNTNLKLLDCGLNQITSLNLSKTTALEILYCVDNPLESLDVSYNPALTFISCGLCGLSSLNLSNNPNLKLLACGYNNLSSLDISKNTALESLTLRENPLSTLDISQNIALKEMFLTEMPSLHQVCVWTLPFPPAGSSVATTGSPNIYFTTDCSK